MLEGVQGVETERLFGIMYTRREAECRTTRTRGGTVDSPRIGLDGVEDGSDAAMTCDPLPRTRRPTGPAKTGCGTPVARPRDGRDLMLFWSVPIPESGS